MAHATIEQVEIHELEQLMSGDCLCELPQQHMPHPCSSRATHSMRFRCGGYPRTLVCDNWIKYFQGSLVPDDYRCAFCRSLIVQCWEFLPI